MKTFMTEYGPISDLVNYNLYENGILKDCTNKHPNILKTKYGDLIPQYNYIDVRRKYIKSLSFFPDGKLSRISLNEQTPIKTSIGIIKAELITFYPNGNINRIFPLNGQLSGYWDEEQEYELTSDINFSFPIGNFVSRATGIYFYENGHVKGLSLWTNETIQINTPIGNQSIRLGLSLYENGNIKSFEPNSPLSVLTPIGHILAFDANDYLFFKECKSVNFYENGTIESIMTSKSKITVFDHNKNIHTYEPRCYDNFDDGDFYIYPLKISFSNNTVSFNDSDNFIIDKCTFTIDELSLHSNPLCKHDCSACGTSCSIGSISII